jgi:hypothetical protein
MPSKAYPDWFLDKASIIFKQIQGTGMFALEDR